MFYFQAKKKKKKIVTKQVASPQILKKKKKKTTTKMDGKPTASPTDYRGSKPTDSPKKKKKNQAKPQYRANHYGLFGSLEKEERRGE